MITIIAVRLLEPRIQIYLCIYIAPCNFSLELKFKKKRKNKGNSIASFITQGRLKLLLRYQEFKLIRYFVDLFFIYDPKSHDYLLFFQAFD